MSWHVYTQALLKTTGADDDCSLGSAFDRQIRRYGGAFEHCFGSKGREIERSNLQKFKCPGFAGGAKVLKSQVNWLIKVPISKLTTYSSI